MTVLAERIDTQNRSGTLAQAVIVLLAASLVMDGIGFPGLGIPVNAVATGLLVLTALIANRQHVAPPMWMTVVAVAGPSWIAIASVIAGNPDLKRLANLGLFSVLTLVIAYSWIDTTSLGRGMAIGMVGGVVWGAATLQQSSYAHRLTGLFGDPNTAGLIIAVFTALALPAVKNPAARTAILVTGAAGIWLTESRTAFLAGSAMLAWALLHRLRLNPWVAVAALSLGFQWVVTAAQDGFLGDTFTERYGSDQLRQRINDTELAQVATSPWTGHGAGTARVLIDGRNFFFHSSYLSVRSEGGWIAFILVVGLLAVTLAALLSLGKFRNTSYEAALIGVAICALNLGEALMTIMSALAIGAAMHHIVITRQTRGRHKAGPPQEPLEEQLRRGYWT